ncbi:hypothetical protein GQ457_16G014180 [Hibiscus cannabinus]
MRLTAFERKGMRKIDGVLTGLLCAWNLGFRRIVLELDSLDAYRLLSSDDNMYRFSSILAHIKEIQERDWLITVHHVSRTGNKVVDFLAKRALSGDIVTDLLLSSPAGIHDLLRVDLETD